MPDTVLVNAGPRVAVPPPGLRGHRERPRDLIPDNQMMGIAHAHMSRVLGVLEEARGEMDLVQDNLEVVGAAMLAAAGHGAPPALQTLHWDLRKHPDFYAAFDGRERMLFNAVSEPQRQSALSNLRRQMVAAIPLATDVDATPFQPVKGDTFLVLARFTAFTGQDAAARICGEHGWRCDPAGPVAGIPDPQALDRARDAARAARRRRSAAGCARGARARRPTRRRHRA